MGTLKQIAISGRFIPKAQRAFVDAVLGDDRLLKALIHLEEQVASDVPNWLRKGELGGFCVRVPPGYFHALVEDVVWLCSKGQTSGSSESEMQAKLELCEKRLAANTREYLREVTLYRDRLAERTRFGEQEVLEEELYVYEPLQYFDKDQQQVMREIIDERVRQLVARRSQKRASTRNQDGDGTDDELAELREDFIKEQNKLKEAKAALEVAQKAKREAEKTVSSMREEVAEAKNLAQEKTREAAEHQQQYKRMEVEKEKLEKELQVAREEAEQLRKDITAAEEKSREQALQATANAKKLNAFMNQQAGTGAQSGTAHHDRDPSFRQQTAEEAREAERRRRTELGLDPDGDSYEEGYPLSARAEKEAFRRESTARLNAIQECELKFESERHEFRKTISKLHDVVNVLKLKLKKAEDKIFELEDKRKPDKGKKAKLEDLPFKPTFSGRNVFIRLNEDAVQRLCRMEDLRGKVSFDRELDLWRTGLKQREESVEDSVQESINADLAHDQTFRSTMKKQTHLSIVSALEDDPETEPASLEDTVKAFYGKLSPNFTAFNSTNSYMDDSTKIRSLHETPVVKHQRRLVEIDDRRLVAQSPLEMHFPEPAEDPLAATLKPLHAMSRPSSSPGLFSGTRTLKRPASSPGLTRMRPLASVSKK